MDERRAIEEALAGQAEAFGGLVIRYQAAVYAVALAHVFDPQDAQDLSQETFLRAYLRLPTLRNRDAFGAWLFTILRRLCTDFMRGRWRMLKRERPVDLTNECVDGAADPRDTISAKDVADTLWARVGQLDERSREVLSLHYGQQLGVNEIASLTGVGESAVKMRLKHARAVLGEKVDDLRSVWGSAPLVTLSGGVISAVKTVGPVKAGMAAGGLFGLGVAWMALFGWLPVMDLERWRGHAPQEMLRQSKRTFVRIALLLPVLMVLSIVISALAAMAMRTHVPAGVPLYSVITFLVFLSLVVIFKREIELISPGDKARQFFNATLVILMFIVMALQPSYLVPCFGLFLFLQYFVAGRGLVAIAVPPGFWLAPMLAHADKSQAKPVAIAGQHIKRWITILHEYGLVAPPCKRREDSITVRLRCRNYYGEKMAWGLHSSLQAATDGTVTCEVVPRDYVALVKCLGSDELPGRRELGQKLGETFTRALSVYGNGGNRAAIASSLGLADCPLDSSKTSLYKFQKYVMPLVGIALLIASLFYEVPLR